MTEPLDKDLDDILEAAANWHAKLDLGTANTKTFEKWRSADPRHAAAFARIVGTDESFEEIKHLIPSEVDEFEVRPPAVSRRQWMRGAISGAAVVIVGGGAAFGFMNRRANAETGVGERQSLTLPDGGRLDLNTDTQVSWRYAAEARDVWLKRGEIAVAAAASGGDQEIHALGYTVQVYSGETNVRIRGDALEVTCLTGTAQVFYPATKKATNAVVEQAPPVLKPGQAFYSAAPTNDIKTLKEVDLQSVKAWQSDEIVFTGQTLAVVVEEFNRYLTRKIVIRDTSLSAIRLGGRFNVHDSQAFLNGLMSSFGIKVSNEKDVTVLSR